MSDFIVKGKVSLDTGDFIGSAKRASDSLNGMNTSTTNATKKFNLMGGVMRKLTVGALAAFTIKLGIDSVRAATEASTAQDRLKQILLTTGGATEEHIKLLNAQAEALEATTVVTAGNVTVVQSQLATFDLMGGSIAKLTPAILDYVVAEKGASATAGDFKAATNGLAQALNGQFGALTRVGFIIPETDKKLIKSGTESERAAAIVRTLETTYKDFAVTAGQTAAGAQIKFINSVNKLKDSLGNALIPIIARAREFLTSLLPAIQKLQEKFADGKAIQKFVDFFVMLGKNIADAVKAIALVVEPIFRTIIFPAIMFAVAAFVALIKVIGATGRFIQKNIGVFQALLTAFVALGVGIGAYILQVKVYNAVSKVMIGISGAKALVLKKVTKAFKILNFVMRMNPIGFVIGLLAALAVGFAMAWNKSETFRKIVVKGLQIVVNGFGYAVGAVGKFLEGLSKIPGLGKKLEGPAKAVNNFANEIREFSNGLDSLAKKSAKPIEPKIKKPKIPKMPDLSSLFEGTGKLDDPKGKKAAADAKKKLDDIKRGLDEAVQGFNDFIANDFTQGFMEGMDRARDTVLRGLDEAKKVFDAAGKGLEGAALKKVEGAFDALNEKVRAMIPKAMQVAKELEEVQEQVKAAKDALEQAIKSREEGVAAFVQMLAEPFGEQSELNTALSGAEASVSSIIGMYDKIVDAVNKRYEGLDPAGKNELLAFLKKETQQLVDLANQRNAVAKDLEKAQEALADAISSRTSGASTIADALKSSFGQSSELANALSEGRATADSIIGMFETISKAIEARYVGIDPSGKSALLTALENQTKRLLELVKKRDEASKALAEAQKHLDSVLAKQSEMRSSVTGSLKSFGTALANLSSGNSASTIKVIKTATGMVITQMKEGSQGVQSVTDQLKSRLQSIKDFSKNIRDLLASGLNREFIQQLLNAGPEAAGATAALLASSGQDQINEINNLYSSINAESEAFGTQMADTFHGNSVAMAEAMVAGAASEFENIVAEMTRIKDGIAAALSPLSILGTNLGTDLAQGLVDSTQKKYDAIMAQMKKINDDIAEKLKPLSSLGTKLGTDLAQGLFDALKSREAALVALAKSIADQIAMHMMQAMASIGAMQASQAQAAATAAAASAAAAKAAASASAAKAVTTVIKTTTTSPSTIASAESGVIGAASIAAQIAAAAAAAVAPKISGSSNNDAQNTARLIAEAAAKSAASNSTVVEKGAVTVTIGGNIPVEDVEGIMTRSLTNALRFR